MERRCRLRILGKTYEVYVHGNSIEELDEQEQITREAEKKVNATIAAYQNKHSSVTDNGMILSVVALDFAIQSLELLKKAQSDPGTAKLRLISELLDKSGLV